MRGDTGSYAIAKDMGLTATTFSNVELGRIEREFKDLQVRMKKGGDQSPLKIYGMVRHVLGTGMDKVGDMYGFIDALGKTMMLKHEMDNNGLTQEEAAGQADKWLFDYSLVRPSVKYTQKHFSRTVPDFPDEGVASAVRDCIDEAVEIRTILCTVLGVGQDV